MQVRFGRSDDRHLVYTLINLRCMMMAAGIVGAAPLFSTTVMDHFRRLRDMPLVAGYLGAVVPLLQEGAITGAAHLTYLVDCAAGVLQVRSLWQHACTQSWFFSPLLPGLGCC